MDQFICFGDSITQQAFSSDHGSFGPLLTDAYIRRLDIINRGFSGYNTSQALHILPQVIPAPHQARVRFLMIFFGANDARLPNTPGGPQQHVPLEQYRQNLKAIATHPRIREHEDIRVILVTPPPIEERKLAWSELIKYDLDPTLRRTAAITADYAKAVRELGAELNLPVLDLWMAMIVLGRHSESKPINNALPGSRQAPECAVLQELLHDGLHLSRPGYQVWFDQLMTLIQKTWPDQMPEKLSFVFPRWDDEEAWSEEAVGKL